ncbi:MAG: galactofuranose transport system substrate-binding protein, partial [Pseudonocardiales bacterium]|nr:galactofuranose transport system substrate-binding protein [Pseudonocardiales bacterium]
MESMKSRRMKATTVAVAVTGLLVAGCSSKKSTSTTPPATAAGSATTAAPAGGSSSSSNPNPVVASSSGSAGAGCTASSLGYPTVAIKGAKVGFSQSEPETAAFRIAETKSMVDEAKAQGATLIHTDANSQIAKQVTDIEGMLNDGVQLLIVAPLNSDGLQPAFDAAKAKHVPVVTVDRLVNSTACTDYLT